MYVTSGFCEVTLKAAVAAGYREQMTSCGFSIAGFDPVNGPSNIFTAWAAFLQSIGWPSTAFATGVDVKVGTADPSAPLVYTFTGNDPGTGSAGLDPPATSILVNKLTLLGGRSGRGRMFIAQPNGANTFDDGTLSTAYLTSTQGFLDTLIAAIETVVGGDAYLLHSGPSPAPTLIQSFVVDRKLGTQRRRNAR